MRARAARKQPLIRRLQDRPIVAAGDVAGYGPVFNAGVVHHDGCYHLFARAVRVGYRPGGPGGPRYVHYRSDVVVLTSRDGRRYEFGYVLAPAGTDGAVSFEDPRVQRVGGRLVMTYTHLPPAEVGPHCVGAYELAWDGRRFGLVAGSGRILGRSGVADKDGVLFDLEGGRVGFIHRIHPSMQLATFDSFDALWNATDTDWDDHLARLDEHRLLEPEPGALAVGAGAPPVRVDGGFLCFFHQREGDGIYTMRLALLDSRSGRVAAKLDEPVLEPELNWEREGDVDNVIFVQGAHVDGDRVYLTYGAADRHVGAAEGSVSRLLAALSRRRRRRAA